MYRLLDINRALEDGCNIYGRDYYGRKIRSVSIQKGKDKKAKRLVYAEGTNIEEALKIAGWRYFTRLFKRIGYKHKTRYFYGRSDISSLLDYYVIYGNGFLSWQEADQIVVEIKLRTMVEDRPPSLKRAKQLLEYQNLAKQRNQAVLWTDVYGLRYKTKQIKYGNKEYYKTNLIKWPKNIPMDGLLTRLVTKTGKGEDFLQAVNNALVAEEVEPTVK